jgi:hypothetical protein
MIWRGPDGFCVHSGFASQMNNHELKESESFSIGSKQTCLLFALEEDVILVLGNKKC